MFDYLQKFNKLPKEIKDNLSSPEIMHILSELEKKYHVELAMIVMKIATEDLLFDNLPIYFVSQLKLGVEEAEELSKELKDRIFKKVFQSHEIKEDYSVLKTSKDIEVKDFKEDKVKHDFAKTPFIEEGLSRDTKDLMKEISLILPSQELNKRFENIINIYLKGIRNKIDTRLTLAKPVVQGGLNLSLEQITKIFKIYDRKKADNESPKTIKPVVSDSLERIVKQADQGILRTEEYNLQKAIADRKSKSLDTKHELIAGDIPKELTTRKKIDSHHLLENYDGSEEMEIVKYKEPSQPEDKIKNVSVKYGVQKENIESEIINKKEVKQNNKVISKIPQTIKGPVKKKIKLFSRITNKVKPKEIVYQEDNQVKRGDIDNQNNVTIQPRINVVTPSSRPQVSDIKAVPKVLSPIDELRYLSLVDFRRLGSDPKEMVSKVFSKIRLLEQGGYDKMIRGVKAWRQGPVNRLYLRIGQEAINKGISMEESIKQRQRDNKDYLSSEEIEEIINLNNKLIF